MADEQAVAVPTNDAGASSAAPVSAPETPSTPTSSSADSGVSTQVAEPVNPATLTKEVGEEDAAFLRRAHEAREKYEAGQKAKGAEPAKAAEKTSEQQAAEQKAEADKAAAEAQAKADAEAKAKAEAEKPEDPEQEPMGLDGDIPLSPKDIAAKVAADPELAAKLEAAGIKDQVFANARLAIKAGKFAEVYLGGVDDAIFAKQQAETFGVFDDLFTGITAGGAQTVDALIGKMMELDTVVDDSGKPVLGADGKPQSQGNVQAFISTIADDTFRMRLEHAESEAKEILKADPESEEGQTLLAAVNVLKARSNGPATEELTPFQKAEAERLKAERSELDRRQQADATAQHEQREENIALESDKQISGELDAILGKTDLRKEQLPLVAAEIRQGIANKLAADRTFTSRREWIMRAPWNPNVEKQRIAHNVNSMRGVLRSVTKDVLTKYGAKVISEQKARDQKIATQVRAMNSEPKGTTSVAPARAPLSSGEVRKKAMDIITEKGGDPYDPAELNRVMIQLRAQGV